MAKDGTNRGGARPGAGRKPKTLKEKLDAGNPGNIDACVLNENGGVDTAKLGAIAFDPINSAYLVLGEKVGNAFSDGKKLG